MATKFTQEQYDALTDAIADGTKSVKYSDKEVVYRTLDEMLKLRNLMKKELCLSDSKTDKGLFGGRRINPKTSKGLC